MKQAIATMLAMSLLFGTGATLADECKYQEDGLDPFSSDRVVLTKWKSFQRMGNQAVPYGWMAGLLENGRPFLALRLGLVGYRGIPTIAAGGKLQIHMADDTIVELAAHEEIKIEHRNVVVKYGLTAETIAALAAQGMTDIRVSSANDDHDFLFSRKPNDRMQYVVGCIPKT
jgi:hypothetical protein